MKPLQACMDKEQLFAYSTHMLDPRQKERVEAHLNLCASCRNLVAGFERLDSLLGEWKPVEPSPWFDARARAHIASGIAAQPRFSLAGFGWKRWAPVAAIAILAVGTSMIALRHTPRSGSEVPSEIAVKSVPNPASATLAVTRPAKSSAQEAPVANDEAGPRGTAALGQAESAESAESASQEMDLYKHLKVLENYDMLANFDVLSELPQASDKTSD